GRRPRSRRGGARGVARSGAAQGVRGGGPDRMEGGASSRGYWAEGDRVEFLAMRRVRAVVVGLLLAGIGGVRDARALDLPALVERTKPSVVHLTVLDALGRKVGQGTGFFADKGQVVTNHHVIDGGSAVTATLSDGTVANARGLLVDEKDKDIAVLAVDADR